MEARTLAALLCAVLLSTGASHRTANFVANASSKELAVSVAQSAEQMRRTLAMQWLGHELPNWEQPCPIEVKSGANLGAGGATSFVFHHGQVFDWTMSIQGTPERILDSVLPHEVTHTIFASHFRRPLPRWADEGACTTVEHLSERQKQQRMLIDFLRTGRGIPFSSMFAMKEYPADILPLYSQGYSLARFLIDKGGKRKFVSYLADGMQQEEWLLATRKHYGYPSLAALQDSWLDWVKQGSPLRRQPSSPTEVPADGTQLAANDTPQPPAPADAVYRGQNPGFLADTLGRLVPIGRKARARNAAQAAQGEQPGAGLAAAAAASSNPPVTSLAANDSPFAVEPSGSARPSAGLGTRSAEPPVAGSPASSAPAGRKPPGRQVLVEWSSDDWSETDDAPPAASSPPPRGDRPSVYLEAVHRGRGAPIRR